MDIRYCGKCARLTPAPVDTNEHERCPWCGKIVWESVARDCGKPLDGDIFEFDRKRQGLKKTARGENHTAQGKVDKFQPERDYWIAKYKAEGKGKPVFDHCKRRKLAPDTTVIIINPVTPAIGCHIASQMRKEKGVKIVQPLAFVETKVQLVAMFKEEESCATKFQTVSACQPAQSPCQSVSTASTETFGHGAGMKTLPSSPMESDFDDGIPWAEDVCEVVEVDLPVRTRVQVSKCLSETACARAVYRKFIVRLTDYAICETRRWIDSLALLPDTDLRSYHSVVCELEAEKRARGRANEFVEQVETRSIIGAFKKSA